MKKVISIVLSIVLLTALTASTVMAQTPPDFPVCSNPQGTLKVKYDEGIHAIAGDQNAYTGADSVYTVDESKTLQCFCADSGNGIQTNWWKPGEISQEEIDNLVKLGWIYVPDGSIWGLQSGIWMAFNSTYSCKSDGGTGGSSSSSSSNSGTGGSPSVLGLASTGNSALFYTLLAFGVSSTLLGISLKKFK